MRTLTQDTQIGDLLDNRLYTNNDRIRAVLALLARLELEARHELHETATALKVLRLRQQLIDIRPAFTKEERR